MKMTYLMLIDLLVDVVGVGAHHFIVGLIGGARVAG